MSDDEYTDEGEERVITISRDQIRSLEAKAKRAEDAESRAESAERELAFAQAGINPNDTKLSYFRKGYEGDVTAEAIRAAAIEAGFLSDPDAVPAEEVAAQRRMTAISTDAAAVTTDDLNEQIKAATTSDEVMRLVREAGLPTPDR